MHEFPSPAGSDPCAAIPVLNAVAPGGERDQRRLFAGLSFRLHEDDMLRIRGLNGSGKNSRLYRLSQPTPGHVELFSQALSALASRLLWIGHAAGVKAVLTAEENLAWLGTLHGHGATVSIGQVLAAVSLPGFEDTPCYALSAGQVSVAGPEEARLDNIRVIDFVVKSDRAQPTEIVQRVQEGRLCTNIGTIVTLDDAIAAFNSTVKIQESSSCRKEAPYYSAKFRGVPFVRPICRSAPARSCSSARRHESSSSARRQEQRSTSAEFLGRTTVVIAFANGLDSIGTSSTMPRRWHWCLWDSAIQEKRPVATHHRGRNAHRDGTSAFSNSSRRID